MKSVGIFVPARLSSHRLPNKQILPIGDTCMFDICCRKLDEIKRVYNINTYVLICDDKLISIAEKYSNVIIIRRDVETAKAEAPLQYIYKDILGVTETHLMFLNPCLIFLKVETIIENIKKFINSDKEYGTSCKEFKNWLWKNEDTILTDIDYRRLTTKEIKPLWQCAHCFHIFNKENFRKDGYMLKDDLMLLPIKNEVEVIDIDTYDEYLYAKWRYENKN